MCTVLSPASFLAIAFREAKKNNLNYQWLNAYRLSLQAIKSAKGPVDVSWNHDSVNYTMGFFSPVFSSNEKGIHCNLKALNLYYEEITLEIGKDLLKSVQACAKSCGKAPAKSCGTGKRKKITRGYRTAH